MQPIDPDGEQVLSEADELAVLLAGFEAREVLFVRAMLDDIGADMVKVCVLSGEELAGDTTLGDALAGPEAGRLDEALVPPSPPGVPRVCFLGGMSGSEVYSVLEAFRESDLPAPIFAGAVPNNVARALPGLLEELSAEQAAMAANPPPGASRE